MNEKISTCGQGLAANAVLPENLAGLLRTLADLLENHTRALDNQEENGRLEREAYMHLVGEQRAIAAQLRSLAEAMRSYRNLPIASHDMAVLSDPKSLEVFASYLRAEENLQALMRDRVTEHQAMLHQLRGD
jgi:hypothetical protein